MNAKARRGAIALFQDVLRDLKNGKKLGVFARRTTNNEVETRFVPADVSGRIDAPDKSWIPVSGRREQIDFVAGQLQHLRRSQGNLTNHRRPFRSGSRREVLAATIAAVRSRNDKYRSSGTLGVFVVDSDRPFVYVGGSAESPVQSDKAANLPGE